jgi:hypothetical protein
MSQNTVDGVLIINQPHAAEYEKVASIVTRLPDSYFEGNNKKNMEAYLG